MYSKRRKAIAFFYVNLYFVDQRVDQLQLTSSLNFLLSNINTLWKCSMLIQKKINKLYSIDINNMSDSELLNTPIRAFNFDFENLPFKDCFEELSLELKSHGILFEPHFWFSDDWFSPSGIPGIGVPFYLAHPRLLRLYSRYVGLAEGTTQKSFMKLLRHETGHAFEHAYKLEKNPHKEQWFGSTVARYPKSYTYKPYSKAFVRHLGEGYAQSHPDEDFAETFAVWLDPVSDWQNKYKNWLAIKKLKAVDFIVRRVSKRRPLCTNKKSYDSAESMLQLFGDFLKAKAMEKSKDKKNYTYFTKDLSSFCHVEKNQYKESTKLLVSHRKSVVASVADGIGARKYKVEPIYNEYIKHQKKHKLHFSGSNKQKQRLLLDLLTAHSIKSLAENRDRVIM